MQGWSGRRTFEGLTETAPDRDGPGSRPVVGLGADVGWPLTDWLRDIMLRSAGADMYDQLAAHEIPWTDESVITAMETVGEILGDPDFLVGGNQGAAIPLRHVGHTGVHRPPAGATVTEGDFVAGTISGDTEAVVGEVGTSSPSRPSTRRGVVGHRRR